MLFVLGGLFWPSKLARRKNVCPYEPYLHRYEVHLDKSLFSLVVTEPLLPPQDQQNSISRSSPHSDCTPPIPTKHWPSNRPFLLVYFTVHWLHSPYLHACILLFFCLESVPYLYDLSHPLIHSTFTQQIFNKLSIYLLWHSFSSGDITVNKMDKLAPMEPAISHRGAKY